MIHTHQIWLLVKHWLFFWFFFSLCYILMRPWTMSSHELDSSSMFYLLHTFNVGHFSISLKQNLVQCLHFKLARNMQTYCWRSLMRKYLIFIRAAICSLFFSVVTWFSMINLKTGLKTSSWIFKLEKNTSTIQLMQILSQNIPPDNCPSLLI